MKAKIAEWLGWGELGLLTCLCLVAVVFYGLTKIQLKDSRRKLLNTGFQEIGLWLFLTGVGFAVYWGMEPVSIHAGPYGAIRMYIGAATLIAGAVVFVKLCKNVAFHYLFLLKPGAGVPELVVNMITLIISIFVTSWMLTSIFEVRLAPLLATSALLSVVLGLALQDTLGNLFAGVAMQFDKPYEIGDWIEVHTEKEVFRGEVHEITWRATVLFGFLDEVITLPNRMIAQNDVSNFSGKKRPIYRSLGIHLDTRTNPETAKKIFEDSLKNSEGVRQDMKFYILLREMTEKGMLWRVVYSIHDYGQQYVIMDRVNREIQKRMEAQGIKLGRIRVEMSQAELT